MEVCRIWLSTTNIARDLLRLFSFSHGKRHNNPSQGVRCFPTLQSLLTTILPVYTTPGCLQVLSPTRKEKSYNDRRFWFYILFIIIIGGILVLFIYITRLALNEIFSPSNKINLEVGRAKNLSAPLYNTPVNESTLINLRCPNSQKETR
jgi:hypothetical protein